MITISTYIDKNFYSSFLNLQGGETGTLDVNSLTVAALKSLIIAELTKRVIISSTDLLLIKNKLSSLTNGNDFDIDDISEEELELLADKLISTGDFSTIKTVQGKGDSDVILSPEDIGTVSLESLEITISDLDARISTNTDNVTNLINNKSDKYTTLSGYGITDSYTKDLVYTKVEVDDVVEQRVSSLVGIAPTALDTIEELAQGILDNQDLIDTLNNSVGNRVRFDVDNQPLTITQKTNARTNIEAEKLGTAASLISLITPSSIGAAIVATTGSYNDLVNKPVIPESQVNSDWTASSGISQILNKPNFSTVATSGSYIDLTNKPVNATTSVDGFMSATDKTKLDGLSSSGGGLTNISEYISTTTPNTTARPAIGFTTIPRAETNVNVVVQPKGSGFFSLNAPDNSATGGNLRGSYSVDLQLSRAMNSSIVDGQCSFGAGYSNRVNAAYSASFGDSNAINSTAWWSLAAGQTNTINGNYGTVSGYNNSVGNSSSNFCTVFGRNNTVSGSSGNFTAGGYNTNTSNYTSVFGSNCTTTNANNSFCGGSYSSAIGYSWMFSFGNQCQTSGDTSIALGNYARSSGSSAVAIGNSNYANANYSFVIGNYGSAKGIIGAFAFGLGGVTQSGNTQSVTYPLNVQTTDATETNLNTNNLITLSANNTITIPVSSTYAFQGTIVARTTTGETAVWDVKGIATKGSNITSTAFVGSPTITQRGATSGASSWGLNVVIENTTLGAIIIKVTGQASTNIRWTGKIETVEITY